MYILNRTGDSSPPCLQPVSICFIAAMVPVYKDLSMVMILGDFVRISSTRNNISRSIWSYATFKSIIQRYRGDCVDFIASHVMNIASVVDLFLRKPN